MNPSGKVGIGTSSPQAVLHALNSGSAFNLNTATDWAFQDDGAAGNSAILAVIGGTTGSAISALALAGLTIFTLYYFGQLVWTTAVERELPGWIGLLVFVRFVCCPLCVGIRVCHGHLEAFGPSLLQLFGIA